MFITKANSNNLSQINTLIYSMDMYNRDSLINLIKKAGINNCSYVSDFSSIESTIQELEIELLFLEIDIYDVKETKILEILKTDKNHRNIPLILISMDKETQNISYAKELGFDEILLKPFNFPMIKEILTDLTKKYDKRDTWYILNSIEKLIDDGNLEMAIKYIKNLENKINDFYIKYLKALYYFKKENYQESIKELKLLLMFKPTCFSSHKLLAECYDITNEKKKKLEALENVILFSPKNPKHNFEIGKSYLENNNSAKAEKHLKYVEKINPNHKGLNNNLANLYIKKGDTLKAKKYLKKLEMSRHTLSIKELNEIGMNLNKSGNKKEALDFFVKAWEQSKSEKKENPVLLFNLSSVYFELEKYEKALFYINLALKIKVDFIEAKKLKSRILLKATLKNNE
jgi:tetratricopeptide (TPR) repeat protein